MKTSELVGLSIFLIFWGLVFFFEIRYFILFIRRKARQRSGFQIIIHILAFVGIVCFLYGYFIEPYWIDVQHVEILTDKLKKSEITVVQISDLHCDEKIRNENKLPGIINEQKADIIVFTGDSLNTSRALPVFKKMMSEMSATIGKYAVAGNFDYWFSKKEDLFNDTGFLDIGDRSVTLSKNNETFTVSGLRVFDSFKNLSFLKSLASESYNILLYHYPGINENVGDAPIDLFLAGHTHGGQVALPLYGAIITLSRYGKKYEAGRYDVGGRVLYVNRGIGMEGGIVPRVRFFARPEITVFHIKPRSKTGEEH